MNDKVLVITDSLGLPRAEPELLLDEDCWTHRLSKLNNIDVYHYMRGGYSTRNLRKDLNAYLKGYKPNLVLLQIGIVDCAPRAMGRLELKLISKIPLISTLIHFLVKKYRAEIIRRRKVTYVKPSKFESNLLKVKAHFESADIFALPIAPANRAYIAHSPGVEENITEYNKILSRLFKVIDPYDTANPEDIFMSDNHHLNKYGHTVVFNKISDFFANDED
jgi:hypothetical protein